MVRSDPDAPCAIAIRWAVEILWPAAVPWAASARPGPAGRAHGCAMTQPLMSLEGSGRKLAPCPW